MAGSEDVRHFTPEELSERLRVPLQTLKYWRRIGYGPKPFRAGKHVRYRETEIEAWEKSQLTATK